MSAVLLVVGALTGLHAATWGAYKDARFEGFRPAKFVRSVVLGIGVAVPVGRLSGMDVTDGLLVVIGLSYAAERLSTEWWKAILREDDQGAYTIPMRLAVRGRTVDAPIARYAVGLAVLVSLATALAATVFAQSQLPGMPGKLLVVLGGIGGWLTAFGGAWKDAPVEGFQLAKFFRSPVVATAWALVLVAFTSQLAVLAVAAGGLSVASIETYKTFLNGGAPGKFGDKPVRFASVGVRRTCRTMHGSLYALMTLLLAAGFFSAAFPTAGRPREDVALAHLPALLLCCGFAFVVLAGKRSQPGPNETSDEAPDRAQATAGQRDGAPDRPLSPTSRIDELS